MPFRLQDTNCSPLVIDYEYEIADKVLLSKHVGELLLGNHWHIFNIINALASNCPMPPNESIDCIINMLKTPETEKRDGWLFQMISWLVLAHRNKFKKYHLQNPQSAPAQHGIDGLAILLNDDNSLCKIIITEDKCTTNPRNLITQQVFPEFKSFEKGKKDHALVGIISAILGNIDVGAVLASVQNDIYNKDYRVYRIGITREDSHNSEEGRKRLFKDYERIVTGDTSDRRSGATIYIANLRDWMADFTEKIIAYLETKKNV